MGYAFNLAPTAGVTFLTSGIKDLYNPHLKNGDTFDPNNYQGIYVNSNLGKDIFWNNKHKNSQKSNVLCKGQIGFFNKSFCN